MKRVHRCTGLAGQVAGQVQDIVVKRRGFVMFVGRIDSRDEGRLLVQVLSFCQPQRGRAGSNQVPVRIRE